MPRLRPRHGPVIGPGRHWPGSLRVVQGSGRAKSMAPGKPDLSGHVYSWLLAPPLPLQRRRIGPVPVRATVESVASTIYKLQIF